jgi:hypothetical protein
MATPRSNGYTIAQDRFLLAHSRKIRPNRLHTCRVPAHPECPPLRPDRRFPQLPVPDYHCWRRTALVWHQVRGWPRRTPETLKKRASVLRQRQRTRTKTRTAVSTGASGTADATGFIEAAKRAATEATAMTAKTLRVALDDAYAANEKLGAQNVKLKRALTAVMESA